MIPPTVVENCTLVRRSAFSPRSVLQIFACCSADSAAGAPDFVSSFATLGAGFSFAGACAVGAGFSFTGACAVGAVFSFMGACAVGAGFSFSGACAVGGDDFCGRLAGCWSVFPTGAFWSAAAAAGVFRGLILYTIDQKLNYFMRPIERGSFLRKSNRTD